MSASFLHGPDIAEIQGLDCSGHHWLASLSQGLVMPGLSMPGFLLGSHAETSAMMLTSGASSAVNNALPVLAWRKERESLPSSSSSTSGAGLGMRLK